MFRSSAVIDSDQHDMPHRKWWLGGLLVGMSLVWVPGLSAQGYPPRTAPQNYSHPPSYPQLGGGIPAQSWSAGNQWNDSRVVEPAAYGQGRKKPNRPLHPSIVKMPQAEEELEVIHHRSQLVITRSRIARWAVADPSVVDVLQYSPTEISIIGQAMGATHLTLWFEDEPTTDPLIYRVEVIRDPNWENQQREDYGKLERNLQVLFPDSQVFLVPLTTRVIVKGQARDQEEAAMIMQVVRAEWLARNGNGANGFNGGFGGGGAFGNGNDIFTNGNFGNNNNNNFVINMLEVPGEQMVMVHVRIAQLDRAQLRRFGLDLPNFIKQNGGGSQILTGSISPAAGAVALSGIFENGEISILLDWLASNRTAKIKAEPSITVMNNSTASFLSGGEFAVPTIVGVGGAQGTTTTFRGFGTSLIVTPTIIDKDLIRMRIVPEFSAINSGNASGGVPGLDTRRATTTVQLREGQTIALAGLFSHQTSTEVTRIPFLGELPYFGPRLFNAKESTQGETELLFLVTPEIVRPMEQDEVPPVPGFYVTPPNDYELYHYAMTEGAPDQGVYTLNPYGMGPGMGTEVGYRPHNPALGMYPPGPPNGIVGGSMQTGGFSFPGGQSQPGGFSFPGGQPQGGGMMPNGGFGQPLMTPPASQGIPQPIPDPSVRYPSQGHPTNGGLLSNSPSGPNGIQQTSSWNPFKRFGGKTVPNNVQPAEYYSRPPMQGPVQPAGYQAPRGRY